MIYLRRHLARMVVLILTVCYAVSWCATLAAAVTCDGSGQDLVSRRGGDYGYPHSDGKIHIRYSFDGSGYDAQTLQAATEAIEMWNSRSANTNTVFEPDDDEPDFSFKTSESTCGRFDPNDNGVTVSSSVKSAIQEGGAMFSIGKGIFAHEMGHILALADAGLHPSPASIMNNLGVATGESCHDAMIRGMDTVTVQDDDAATANGCIGTARSDNYTPVQDTYTEPSEYLNCFEYYLISRTYWCTNGQCTLLTETSTYLGVGCPYLY